MADQPRYFNRELSWLEFNQRVLDEALEESLPLLERLKFLAITASNLDEFFMVRVGGLQVLVGQGISATDPSGMTPSDQLAAISRRTHEMVQAQHATFRTWRWRTRRVAAGSEPPTASAGLAGAESEIFSVLTPMAVRPGEPFPLS
jgi:polyphosphate kinase